MIREVVIRTGGRCGGVENFLKKKNERSGGEGGTLIRDPRVSRVIIGSISFDSLVYVSRKNIKIDIPKIANKFIARKDVL